MPVEQALSGQASGSCAQPLEFQCKDKGTQVKETIH